MKYYYLNTSSAQLVSSKQKARQVIQQFIYCASALKKYGFGEMRLPYKSIFEIELFPDYRISQWKNEDDTTVARELKTRLRSIATQSPTLPPDNQNLSELTRNTDVYLDDQPNEALTIAHNDDSIVVSFQSNTHWDISNIEAEKWQINNNNLEKVHISVRNIACIEHLITHIDWIKTIVYLPDIKSSEPLVFRTVSNHLKELEKKSEGDYYTHRAKLNTNEKIARDKEVSKKVAALNLYIKVNIAGAKKDRLVYHTNEREVYLSLDTENGCFECCNTKGKHQGEFDFYGKQTKPVDKTGKHDCWK